MSGQATGWVLRHGPSPEMTDRDGVPYGQRARGLRSVMVCVADAANVDGEHAHPGIQNICMGSLYGRGQVGKILNSLVADGWLRIESQGGGSGKATVYSIPGISNRALSDPLENRALCDDEPRTLGQETAHFADKPRTPGVGTNGLVTEVLNGLDQQTAPMALMDVLNPSPSDHFEEFWKAYPEGRRLAKPDARAAFAVAVKKAAPEKIIQAVRRYDRDPNRLDEFTPYPQKWLKQERWNAPPEPHRAGTRVSKNHDVVTDTFSEMRRLAAKQNQPKEIGQ